MSLTGFCVDDTPKTAEMAVSAVDGNICRCTGYKSIERAACKVSERLTSDPEPFVPEYFQSISQRLKTLRAAAVERETRPSGSVPFVGGGTDVYVQKPEHVADAGVSPLLYEEELRGIREVGEYIEIGASSTVTDLLVSPIMQGIFPDLYEHLKLISSTPIRNMATLAGNFVNASPIGDMTCWFLALDSEIALRNAKGVIRTIKLKDLYLGYKQLAKEADEMITAVAFKKPAGDFRFNFEKVSKRTYLDIATVNTAISLIVEPRISENWIPPALVEGGKISGSPATYRIIDAHVSAGGVSPIPLHLKQTSDFLRGKDVNEETIAAANEIVQSEVSPISDVRGTESYKRLLLRQLFKAHFVALFHEGFH
jgi:xanthine dehydrogenase small subunit